MLIGAHVSPAGGPAKAVERGAEQGAQAIQIFNQNPRAWKPTRLRRRAGRGLPRGHGLQQGRGAPDPRRLPPQPRLATSASSATRRWPRWSPRCRRATGWAPTPSSCIPGRRRRATSGRPSSAREGHRQGARAQRPLRAAPRGHRRRGRDARPLVLRAGRAARRVGRRQAPGRLPGLLPPAGLRLRHPHGRGPGRRSSTTSTRRSAWAGCGSLHLNDSQTPLGSNRDRHARVGQGELGDEGCAVFLSEPRFEDLPCVLETPGPDGSYAKELRKTRTAARAGTEGARLRGRRRRTATPRPRSSGEARGRWGEPIPAAPACASGAYAGCARSAAGPSTCSSSARRLGVGLTR